MALFIALLLTLSARAEPRIYYVHNDHNGAPLMMTDENQRVVWKAHYTPYGEAIIEIEEVELPVRAPGQYYDKESGLHHNYYRDYNSARGGYQQADRIGILRDYSDPQLQVAMQMGIPLAQGRASHQLNQSYAYANSNPIMNFDPFGLEGSCGMGSWECGVYGGTQPSTKDAPDMQGLSFPQPNPDEKKCLAASIAACTVPAALSDLKFWPAQIADNVCQYIVYRKCLEECEGK